MEIAALVSFAILMIAWIVAPDGPPIPRETVETPMPDPQPAAI